MPSWGVRARTRPSQPRARGSPSPASSSSPTAAIRSFLSSTRSSLLRYGLLRYGRCHRCRRCAVARGGAVSPLNRTARPESGISTPAGQPYCLLPGKCLLQEDILLGGVALHGTGCRGGRGRPRYQANAAVERFGQVQAHERPGSLVGGLILGPDHFGVGVLGKLRFDLGVRQRVKLLHADDRSGLVAGLLPRGQEIVVQAAGDQEYAFDGGGRQLLVVTNDRAERAVGEVLDGGSGRLQAQELLGREDDQRLARTA